MSGKPKRKTRGRLPRLSLHQAVEKRLVEDAAARAAKMTAAPRPAAGPPKTLLKLVGPPHLTITLHDRHLLAGEMPLVDLLDAAMRIITNGNHRRGDRRLARWVFRIALRAVCEAIVERGCLPVPLAVHLHCCFWKEGGAANPEGPPRVKEPSDLPDPRGPLRLRVKMVDPQLYAGELPLPQVLDAALDILASGRHRPGDWRGQRWFFRQALRAVCEAVLEEGGLPLPLGVTLHHREKGWEPGKKPKVRTSARTPIPFWPPGATGSGFTPVD